MEKKLRHRKDLETYISGFLWVIWFLPHIRLDLVQPRLCSCMPIYNINAIIMAWTWIESYHVLMNSLVLEYFLDLHMRDRTWPSVRNTSSNVQIFWDLNSPMNRVQLCTWWLFLLTMQKLIQGYALVLLHERLLLKPSNYQNCKNWMDNWVKINV